MNDRNEFAAAWQDATADLTPEERALLATATPEDWVNAAAAAVSSPEFWVSMAGAFVNGFLRGLSR